MIPVNKKVAENMKSYYTRIMPNQPAEDTVTASFTMPRALLDTVRSRARREMTNQSDIMRRALMNSLTPTERQQVLESNSSKPSPASRVIDGIVRKRNKPAAE